jgi:hypothetical protein
MQASTEPQTPTAPAQAPAPPVSITTIGPGGKAQTLAVPRTPGEIQELLARRSELSDQLASVSSRRSELSEEIKTAPDGVSRAGLEDRIRALDQRILQLETDIAATGSQLASAPGDLVGWTQSRNAGDDHFADGVFAGGLPVFAFFAIVFFFARRRWRRRPSLRPDQLPVESATRLERLEHGMEAIAVEIERISEGQRFVTKLLSESHGPIGASNRIAQSAGVDLENPAKR